MTSLQEVVDGVREAQEVVRNLQHNAADLHKKFKVALGKAWERCVYVSLRYKENSEKHMRRSRDAHLLVTVAMSDMAEVQEGSL